MMCSIASGPSLWAVAQVFGPLIDVILVKTLITCEGASAGKCRWFCSDRVWGCTSRYRWLYNGRVFDRLVVFSLWSGWWPALCNVAVVLWSFWFGRGCVVLWWSCKEGVLGIIGSTYVPSCVGSSHGCCVLLCNSWVGLHEWWVC